MWPSENRLREPGIRYEMKKELNVMPFDPYEFDPIDARSRQPVTLGEYTAKTFLWVALGLLITFGIGFGLWATGGAIYLLIRMPYVHLIALLATLFLSITMASRIEKMSVASARIMFIAYSALFGITASTWLVLYDLVSVLVVFLMTAVYFGALAMYGHFTHRDLSGYRSILMSGLIFLIVFTLLGTFLPFMGGRDTLFSLVGIAIFLGFTAYDTQKIKAYYNYYAGYPDMMEKASVFSALQLYLDFINLFLYLLRFMNRSRN